MLSETGFYRFYAILKELGMHDWTCVAYVLVTLGVIVLFDLDKYLSTDELLLKRIYNFNLKDRLSNNLCKATFQGSGSAHNAFPWTRRDPPDDPATHDQGIGIL